MKARGMDAVVSRSQRRHMGFKRKGAPGLAIVVGGAPPEAEAEDAADTIECPSCGKQLADTPENRAYLDSKRIVDEDEAEDMAIEEDAAMDDDEEEY